LFTRTIDRFGKRIRTGARGRLAFGRARLSATKGKVFGFPPLYGYFWRSVRARFCLACTLIFTRRINSQFILHRLYSWRIGSSSVIFFTGKKAACQLKDDLPDPFFWLF